MMADDENKPRSYSDDRNSDINKLSESYDDEDAGSRPGENNHAVSHAPEPEAIILDRRGHGGGNGLAPLGAGCAAGCVSGHGAGHR